MMIEKIFADGPESGAKKIFLCCVLGFALLFAWCTYKVMATPVPGPVLPAADTMQPLVVPEKASVEDSSIITSRPLFWRGRQLLAVEPEKEIAPAQVAAADLDKIKLLGIYGGGVLVSGLKDQTRLVLGEKLGDWKLHRLGHGYAEFSRLGEYKSIYIEQPDVSAITTASQAEFDPEA
ncbi:hypothetical protein [Pseudoteredinibacter isoporae]|uniref:Type II secretion system protein GspC N-terminal domain-containing protein n=1 Tax=Pseudoteredinibacter isoporae TaxID=570281 RepID=A0A7X0MXJ6_9GAMM|nr:hypothetical protein [Pseudoteredinibacter isoporae]MBB6521012.1 hypothetical protein [Pseudoteredinibacter isoporae]NHO86577.1 hypothetical protein [Pseudoteredinibacter isoporae]NIB24971.1 hypothetical protein [Pseudoteredinibacter isoporae]